MEEVQQMATDRFSLEGKVALAVGGTSGIGRQIALGFSDSGARVLAASRTPQKVERTVSEIQARGGSARGYTIDVSKVEGVRELVEQVLKDEERIDILLNCQGMTILKQAEDFTDEDYDRVMDTNLRSVFFTSTQVGRHMLERKSGSIINIASLAAFRGWGRSALYGMSKFGVVSLTETLAREWAPRGVRVNAIAPGFFLTDLNRDKMSAERKAEAIRRTPMARFGELDELVGAAIFLASGASSFVTGTTIRVDGGYLSMGI
jgi:NAD(P)-dependent dehydrogenase (short-subunit alcohol dehydrogenase family)